MTEGRGHTLIIIASCTLAFGWITVLARCWVRLRIVKSFGIDDRLMVAALFLFTWLGVTAIGTGVYGSGRHLADLPPASAVKALQYWWVGELAYTTCTAVTKLSICFFLLRIIVTKAHKFIVYGVMALNAYSIFFFILLMIQCKPISYFWNQHQPGHCINPHFIADGAYIFTGVCIVTDLTLAVLPVFLVWDLNMNARTKIAVTGIIGMGAVASVATIVRIPSLKNFINTGDFLWWTYEIAVWSNIEAGIGIVAGSLATLRPLFRILHNRSVRSNEPSAAPCELSGVSGSNKPKTFPFGLSSMRPAHLKRRSDTLTDTMASTQTTQGSGSRGFETINSESEEHLAPADRDLEMGIGIRETVRITVRTQENHRTKV